MFNKVKKIEVTSQKGIEYQVQISQIENSHYYIKLYYKGEYLNKGCHSPHISYCVENGKFKEQIGKIIDMYEPEIVTKLEFEKMNDDEKMFL